MDDKTTEYREMAEGTLGDLEASPYGAEERDPPANWYVIHTYSGYENKVRENLKKRIVSMKMQDQIFSVLVPTEEEIEFKDGRKKTVQRKVYPGYVLIEMVMTDQSWYVVRNTPGVTGFVSPGAKPEDRKSVV